MPSLQDLVEGIVTDVIRARFQADLVAADLATLYRDDATLRHMDVPTLNISNLSVELRVAFDDLPEQEDVTKSAELGRVLSTGADSVRRTVMELDSVRSTVTSSGGRSGLSRTLNATLQNVAREKIRESSTERTTALRASLVSELAERGVRLDVRDQKRLDQELREFDSRIATVPRATVPSPSIVVGADRLSEVRPEMVSVVRFDVDLTPERWVAVADEDGEATDVLTDT